MSLRIRLALTFAFVAIITATAIAVVTPSIVDHGFRQQLSEDADGRGSGQGLGPGPREGRGPGRAEQETTYAIILVAVVAAAGASLLGFFVAGRLVQPLGRLRAAAADVAAGDLERRSGLGTRDDEIGDLGRSFDSMAEALSRSDAARRRMFQDAAHELKTPLTVIDATTIAILDGVYEHDDRHLETIRQQSQLLARTVDDLRIVSLAESGQMPLDPIDLEVDDVLRRLRTSFAAPAELAGVSMATDTRPSGLVVHADRDRLQQILGALVDNALRHTPAGGAITFRAHSDGDATRLTISDSGPGISPEDLPHLFERFYRADAARQRSAGTSGLGLAIVAALANVQGGSVGAENAPEGGACFWVRLPAGSGIKAA
jgi:two-component system sensor histidine kinase BaeS